MNPIRCAVFALLCGCLAPAWAVHKCTDAQGKVSFQDAPCPGLGENVEVRPAMQGATPVPAPASTAKEGAFGPSWQRKHYLESQGVPQARAAVQRSERECAGQQPAEGVAHAGPLRRTLPSGSQFAQERSADANKDKAACDARTQELRNQLKALEEELGSL